MAKEVHEDTRSSENWSIDGTDSISCSLFCWKGKKRQSLKKRPEITRPIALQARTTTKAKTEDSWSPSPSTSLGIEYDKSITPTCYQAVKAINCIREDDDIDDDESCRRKLKENRLPWHLLSRPAVNKAKSKKSISEEVEIIEEVNRRKEVIEGTLEKSISEEVDRIEEVYRRQQEAEVGAVAIHSGNDGDYTQDTLLGEKAGECSEDITDLSTDPSDFKHEISATKGGCSEDITDLATDPSGVKDEILAAKEECDTVNMNSEKDGDDTHDALPDEKGDHSGLKSNMDEDVVNKYGKVIKEYKKINKKEISLKKGRIVKIKSAPNENGQVFGWTKKGRFSFKKRGVFPLTNVSVTSTNNNT